MQKNNFWKGVLYTSAGGLGWGISGVCSQYLFMNYELESSWLTSVRMLLSGLVLLALVVPKEKKRTVAIFKEKADLGWLVAFAIIGLLMCQYTFLGAIKYSNSATATVLQSLNVIIMAVVMAVWNRKGMGKMQIFAILFAVLGTFLIATGGDPTSMKLSTLGLTMGLLSAVGVVTYTLLSRPIISKWGNLLVTGWGMLIGGVVLCLFTKAWNIPDGFDATAWMLIAVIVIIGTAGGFSFFLEGVKHIGPVKATLIGCLEPASSTVLSALCLGTRFAPVELIGFCCIMATVALSVTDKSKN